MATIISCFGIVFINTSIEDLTKSLPTFSTSWFEAVEAIIIGIIIGLIIRNKSIRNYINTIPFGSFLTGVGIGIIGLGSIGIGIIGSAIIYFKFNNIDFIQLPLNASVVGLSAYCIYLASMWKRQSE